ncbi:MAG: hypothetical protein ACWA40_06670 [Planktomarina sp.]
MALPIAPIASIALRYGAVAIATYAATKAIPHMRRDQRVEDCLDQVEEGIELRQEDGQFNGAARVKRTIRLNPTGPGLEFDFTSLARLKVKRVT